VADYVIGEGLAARIAEKELHALGPEVYFAPGYSFVLTDGGALFYSKFENRIVGPSDESDGQ
jgi:hypothetical protein